MPRVMFTPHLSRLVACPEADVAGPTVAAVLAAYFQAQPAVRGYVLDEHGAVRKHVAIFVDGESLHDRAALSDPVLPAGQIWIMQALSGG